MHTANYGRPLILLKTHVVLVRVACGSNIHTCRQAELIPYMLITMSRDYRMIGRWDTMRT